MDVDPPIPHPVLKRCSSAPMISECENEADAVSTPGATASARTIPSPSRDYNNRASPTFMLCSNLEPRTRRFSASFTPLHSPGTPGRVTPSRVIQLKKEEACDAVGRELASEKEFQSTLQISASWDDLTLSDNESKDCKADPPRRPSSACTEPIHVTLPNGLSSLVTSPYPSPTRATARQCFSPSMQIPVRNSSFSPTPSPSPTRKTFYTSRRSLSPIAIRPSPLGPVKRKCDLDDRGDMGWGPHKKYQHFMPASSSCGGPLLVTQLSGNGDSGESSGGPASGQGMAIPTPDSQSASASSSEPGSPSPFHGCKGIDSPANSPGGRRNSISIAENSNSRSRSTCIVPSPLIVSSTLDDPEADLKSSAASKVRKDFSKLFVPIPPSPGAMDCCNGDSEESTSNSDFPAKPRDPVPKDCITEPNSDCGMMDENMEETGAALSQEQSMSIDSSHSPMDPSV